MDSIPGGMTKERFIELRVQESLAESKDFDLLVMGRPEGPGCYCYVNNLLRDVIGDITSGYDYVVIDNAAGMEHISRRTMRAMDKLVLVSDYSVPGIRSARRIADLASELKIKTTGTYLVVNKVSGPLAALSLEMQQARLAFAGDIPYRESLVAWNIADVDIFGYNDDVVKAKIAAIMDTLLDG